MNREQKIDFLKSLIDPDRLPVSLGGLFWICDKGICKTKFTYGERAGEVLEMTEEEMEAFTSSGPYKHYTHTIVK